MIKQELLYEIIYRQHKVFFIIIIFNLVFSQGNYHFDPTSEDPKFVDENFPPSLLPVVLESSGSKLNGMIYLAGGKGPHPTVILLHGFPGNEKNLDLTQSLRRAGLNVLFFHYRGAWGSEDHFSLSNSFQDINEAINLVSNESFAKSHRIDKSRIILIGHSMGGGFTLLTAAKNKLVKYAVSIAGANFYTSGNAAANNSEFAEQFANAIHSSTLPLNGTTGKKIVEELISYKDEFNLLNYTNELSKLELLMIVGSKDKVVTIKENHNPLVEALNKEGSRHKEVILEADHAFSSKRIILSETIINWLIDKDIVSD